MTVATTLDAGTTSFDDEMTTFTKTFTDSGAVHIYQKFEDTLLYGEKFNYANDSLQQFGSNLTINNIPKQLIKNSSETIYWLKRNWI